MNNKIITSEGNVQFQYPDGGIVNVHPSLIYTVFNEDTVSFMLIPLPKSSGLAIMASKAKDLELNGTIYSIDDLPNAIVEAFSDAGAQARAEIVDELPTTGKTNTIYLVPKEEGEGYDEYIYLKDEQRWELIGDTSIEMKNYLKKVDFNAYSAATEITINSISGAVDTEISNREAADAVISGAIDTEISNREAADTVISGAIDTEISNREAADTVISGAVDTLSTSLANEVSRAQNAETELSNKIDAISGDAEDIQAELDVVSASLESEVSARTEADDAFDARLDEDEKVIGESLNDLNTRMTANEAAESVISGAVDTLSTNLANEVSRAESAETELSNKIDAVSEDVETISGSVESLGDDKANKAEAVASAEYVSSSTTIDLKDISGNVISQVDASDFIIDGMIDDVKIENGYLIIDFNTASGKEDIQIPLTDIFDPSNYYDKTAIDNIVSGLNDSIDAVSGDVQTATADMATKTWVGNQGYLTEHQSLSNYYTKSETSGATQISTALATKQDTLVSGTNIKTINNESILGSGNIDIQGGGKAIEAGRGISITTGETADTVSFNLPISAGTGTGSIVGGKGGGTQGNYSFVFGLNNTCGGNTIGTYIFGEHNTVGYGCSYTSIGGYSNTATTTTGGHIEGLFNTITNSMECTSGWYNVSNKASTTFGDSGNTLFSVGNGTSKSARHNAFEIRQNGDIYCSDGTNDVKLQDTITATAANTTALGGLKLVKLTQAEYDALATKDNSTLYIVTDS